VTEVRNASHQCRNAGMETAHGRSPRTARRRAAGREFAPLARESGRRPRPGRERSHFDFRDRCEEAARAGFTGIGLWHAGLEHVLATLTLGEMKQILADNGLEYLELEFLTDWFIDSGDERRSAADARRRMLLEAAGALEAHHVKVGNLTGTPCAIGKITEEFAGLCAEAARHTAAKIVYEFMPFQFRPSPATPAGLGASPREGA
jgi:sugar phosphate isomerase/epimerase